MQLQVALLPRNLPHEALNSEAIAIVIDTLRFTTTACRALASGAASIRVAAAIEEVRSLASQTPPLSGSRNLLCGERDCVAIPGFDLGNSPLEYTPRAVAGAQLFFTTTNGTMAVTAVNQAQSILLASLVNRQAVVERLAETLPQQVWIVCSGTDGQIALEDVAAAGALLMSLQGKRLKNGVRLQGDAAWLSLALWKSLHSDRKGAIDAQRLQECFANSVGGRNLIQAGYRSDLDFAGDLDSLKIVPESRPPDWECFRI